MEAALVAWVNACSPDSRIDSFGDLADGVVLCRLASLFLEGAGSDKSSVASYLSVSAQPDEVVLGALLLHAIEGPQREQAINVIMALEDSHKAVIAQLIDTQMEGLAAEAPPPPRKKSMIVVDTVAQIRRPSAFVPPDLGADVGDTSSEALKELQAQVQHLRTELLERESQCEISRLGQQKVTKQLRELQEQACHEEDAAHDSERQLKNFESECHRLVDEVSHLEDEALQQRKRAAKDSGFPELQARIDEEARACRVERGKQVDVESYVASVGTDQNEKENLMRAAWTTKLRNVEDELSEIESKMRSTRSLQFQEEQVLATLEFQAEEAAQKSSKCDDELMEMQSRHRMTNDEHQRAQQWLDITSEELKSLKSCDLEYVQQELSMRGDVAARLEQNCGDTHTRSCVREAEIPLLEEALEKRQAEHSELSEKKDKAEAEKNELVSSDKAKALKVRSEITEARGALRREEDKVRRVKRDCDEVSARRKKVQEEANAAVDRQKAVAVSRRPRPVELIPLTLLQAAGRQVSPVRPTEVKATASTSMVQKLREQLQLREKELVWRESQAGEAEALHGKEMQLLSGSIHELGIKYAKILAESENAAAAEQDLQDELEEEALEQQKLKG